MPMPINDCQFPNAPLPIQTSKHSNAATDNWQAHFKCRTTSFIHSLKTLVHLFVYQLLFGMRHLRVVVVALGVSKVSATFSTLQLTDFELLLLSFVCLIFIKSLPCAIQFVVFYASSCPQSPAGNCATWNLPLQTLNLQLATRIAVAITCVIKQATNAGIGLLSEPFV